MALPPREPVRDLHRGLGDLHVHVTRGARVQDIAHGDVRVDVQGPLRAAALEQAFEWALAQKVVPVYASAYIRKVEDFQRLSFARRLDGCLQLRGEGKLTTLRIEPGSALGAVDEERSRGVTSVRELPQGRFIGLDDSGRAVVCLRPAAGPGVAEKGRGHGEPR